MGEESPSSAEAYTMDRWSVCPNLKAKPETVRIEQAHRVYRGPNDTLRPTQIHNQTNPELRERQMEI